MKTILKNKILKWSVIITIIFSMCCGNILNVVAKENAIISVSNASGKLGEEVSLIINLSNLPDMGGIQLIVDYDNDQLQLIDYEIGSLIDSSQEFTNKDYTRNPFKMSWGAGLTKCNLTDNGVAAILTFRILDTAAFGNTNVIVSGDEGNSCDMNLNEITLTSGTGIVTIEKEVHNHEFSDWKIIKKATCTTNGLKSRVCFVCDEEEQVEIPIDESNHNDIEYIITKEPTCENEGIEERKCKSCKKVISTSVIPANRHEWSDWKVIEIATIYTDGKKVRECNVCHKLEEQIIPKISHGNADHRLGEWEIIKEATCTEEGQKVQRCTICEEIVNTEIISANDHKLEGWEIIKEATCIEEGQKVQRCTICEEIINTEIIPANDHQLGELEIIKEATCTEEGQKVQRCTICKEIVNTEIIPANNHQLGEWEIIKEATCTEEGQKVQRCTICEEIVNTEIIPANDHQLGEWKIIKEATNEESGIKQRKCDVCGKIEEEKIPVIIAEDNTDQNNINNVIKNQLNLNTELKKLNVVRTDDMSNIEYVLLLMSVSLFVIWILYRRKEIN